MTKLGKTWAIVGTVVLVLGAILFWGVSRENDKADAQETAMTTSCVRDVSRKAHGLSSSTLVEVVDVAYDRSSTTVTGTFRDTLLTGNPLYTFECSGLNTVKYERAQG